MYLRFGWVVGNAGFGGAVLIVLLAKSVTICTGLSMSSITTNIKIGAGGAYSIISKSLGLEAGGSIGIPFYRPLSKKTVKNEPRNGIIFTGLVIELALITGNLDMLASLIIMFFLVTYGMLNAVVFIQQSMKIISFRPTFRIPRLVPLIGALGCIAIMFLINPMFSFVAICVIIALYVWLERRGLENQGSGDIRGGLFLAIAQRLSYLAAKFPRYQITWKPDLLVPIDDPQIWAGPLLFIRNISYPSGTLFAFTVKENATEHLENELSDLLRPLHEEGILVNSTVIEDGEFLHGAKMVIQTLKSGVFHPNILFLTLGKETQKDPVIQELVTHATKYKLGAMILRQHPRMAFGMQKNINLWLRDKSPNWHLALLIALHLQMNWNATINLVTVTNKNSEKTDSTGFLILSAIRPECRRKPIILCSWRA